MYIINVKEFIDTQDIWKFVVEISNGDSAQHTVVLKKEYWQKLTEGKEKPEELVKRSFEFLLERESKESILKEFDLSVIQTYFPEYEETVGKH